MDPPPRVCVCLWVSVCVCWHVCEIADAGVNIDTVYVATNNRVVFHSADMDGLRAALGSHATHLH